MENELFQQYLDTQSAAARNLEQEYVSLSLNVFAKKNSQFVDMWNANTGRNDEFETMKNEFERIVALNFQHKYHHQLRVLSQKNEQLTHHNDELMDELERQDETIDSLQKHGLNYYQAYVTLFKSMQEVREMVEEIISQRQKSKDELIKIQTHFSDLDSNLKSVIVKSAEPLAEAYGLLIQKHQELENITLKQVPAATRSTRSTSRKNATTTSDATAMASTMLFGKTTTGSKKVASTESDSDASDAYSTPKDPGKSLKAKGKAEKLGTIDESDEKNDDTDDEQEVKEVAVEKKKPGRPPKTTVLSTPVISTRSTSRLTTQTTGLGSKIFSDTPVKRKSSGQEIGGQSIKKSNTSVLKKLKDTNVTTPTSTQTGKSVADSFTPMTTRTRAAAKK
jgi:hypothetical protein